MFGLYDSKQPEILAKSLMISGHLLDIPLVGNCCSSSIHATMQLITITQVVWISSSLLRMPRQYSVAENSSSWNLSNTPNTLGSIGLWPQGRHMAAIKVTDCVCTQPYSALSGVSVILNSASAMDQIISCLHYLSWSVMKFEAVTQQSILPEGKTHSLHTNSTCGGSNSQSMHEKSGFFRLFLTHFKASVQITVIQKTKIFNWHSKRQEKWVFFQMRANSNAVSKKATL